ncbi:MAG: thioredoxin-dependent thiol peroxidase [Bacteroidales bacterium]|nr:thioredoxin-dependent thiol peroxidase [Bacteroidales bacterium]NLK82434.1 thioredoxin-dependent thiol peroxidase [Bacteroidales bacterium]HPY82526.1 thioredoxin-dependent thiol peroxidase [Bacteroidales bacterium]
MTALVVGQKAPNFTGITHTGEEISLSDFLGKKVILYFYPKNNTPGCTAEAKNLNDNFEKLQSLGYEIIGVSPDSVTSHCNFIQKHNLKFTLLSDTDKKILHVFGAWGEKKMYGRTYQGVIRTTFIIDETGIIQKIITKVDTKNHASQILDA